MKKNYRSTFWSLETGNEWIQAFFINGGSDDGKKNVLKYNKVKWKAIEPQVKEWVGEGWMGWERGKPDWFTDNWKSRVPVDWVPKEGKAEHMKARERSVARARERSVVRGGVRERSVVQKLVDVMGGDGGDLNLWQSIIITLLVITFLAHLLACFFYLVGESGEYLGNGEYVGGWVEEQEPWRMKLDGGEEVHPNITSPDERISLSTRYVASM